MDNKITFGQLLDTQGLKNYVLRYGKDTYYYNMSRPYIYQLDDKENPVKVIKQKSDLLFNSHIQHTKSHCETNTNEFGDRITHYYEELFLR